MSPAEFTAAALSLEAFCSVNDAVSQRDLFFLIFMDEMAVPKPADQDACGKAYQY